MKSIAQSPLFKLRQKTGLAYSLCREALNKNGDDIHEAEKWLNSHALSHGLHIAKLRSRSAHEGLISLALRHDKKLATVLELNCETDFVARNQVFKDLTIDLATTITKLPHSRGTQLDLGKNQSITEFKLRKDHLDELQSQIAPHITKLGENIKLSKVIHLVSNHDDVTIFGQIHAKTIEKSLGDGTDIWAGRYGAIVALKDMIRGRSLEKFGDRLCKHIIGFSPTYMELPEGTDREALGESPAIMDQPIIMSEDLSVKDYCRDNEIDIVHFQRFERGENSVNEE